MRLYAIILALDYCCSVLSGVSGTLQRRLQAVFDAAARLVFSARKSEHVTPLLQEFHWLKVLERIQFRLCVLVHRCLHGNAPPYISVTLRLTSDVESRRRLRSGSTSTLLVPSPCFSSGRCTGLECIAFVGQNIVDVLGVSSSAENTAIQGIL